MCRSIRYVELTRDSNEVLSVSVINDSSLCQCKPCRAFCIRDWEKLRLIATDKCSRYLAMDRIISAWIVVNYPRSFNKHKRCWKHYSLSTLHFVLLMFIAKMFLSWSIIKIRITIKIRIILSIIIKIKIPKLW